MNAEFLSLYKTRVEGYQSTVQSFNNELKILSLFRFISFIGLFPAGYFLFPLNTILAILAIVFLISLFLLMVKRYIRAEEKLQFYKNLVKINQNEIDALNRDFKGFDPGSEFIDPRHDYSFDLDLYGKGSLFQFLNRTVTFQGKKRLSDTLNRTQRNCGEIVQRQAAIRELADKLDWRQNFLASKNSKNELENQSQFSSILQSSIPLKKAALLKFLTITLPPVTLLLILANVVGIDPFSFYRLFIIIQWIILTLYFKKILQFHALFENQGKLLNQYIKMLRLIEELSTQDEYLNELMAKLRYNNKSAGSITAELGKLLSQFDYSKNFLAALLLDSIFMWDIRCINKLNGWQEKYASLLPVWFEVIAEFDSLISLSNVNYNHPNWVTPFVYSDGFRLNAENVGHPLIDETRCVTNNFSMNSNNQITIITGANMAGKSTFLRTIGINLVLAANGCKVCAEAFEFSPTRVFTNMRTSDNLMNDESYFYAELMRLQSILTLLRNRETLFVIIDEMLKGTNSIDKLNGSKELVKQLLSLNARGIVATHDLGLTELETDHSEITNKCFEINLNENDLSFSYKLTNGVTKTMNATFLMRKMGIIPQN
jgi:hypothetical protein